MTQVLFVDPSASASRGVCYNAWPTMVIFIELAVQKELPHPHRIQGIYLDEKVQGRYSTGEQWVGARLPKSLS